MFVLYLFCRPRSIATPIQMQNNNYFIYTVYELRNDFISFVVTKLPLHINVFLHSDMKANLNKTNKINWPDNPTNNWKSQELRGVINRRKSLPMFQIYKAFINFEKMNTEFMKFMKKKLFKKYLFQCSPIQTQSWSGYFKHDIHELLSGRSRTALDHREWSHQTDCCQCTRMENDFLVIRFKYSEINIKTQSECKSSHLTTILAINCCIIMLCINSHDLNLCFDVMNSKRSSHFHILHSQAFKLQNCTAVISFHNIFPFSVVFRVATPLN